MEKRDVAIVMIGLIIVLVLAFVVKPVVTGKPMDLSVPASVPGFATPSPTPAPVSTVDASYEEYKRQLSITTIPPTTAPTPVPSWSGQSQGLGFVDPARYNTPVSNNQDDILHGRNISEALPDQDVMVTYATIKGEHLGTTDTLHMPFPYWELRYTVNPWETTFQGKTSNKAAGVAESTGTEVFPSFSITVMDADQPNRTVRVITPQGGLDAALWKKGKGYDPRPWTEQFYEGISDKNYYFVVDSHMILSYQIDILVPQRYIGKY
jgi:hypothetical protein